MKLKIGLILGLVVLGFKGGAQLSGVYSVPGTHPSIANVLGSLNALGVSGPTTINIAAGYTETTTASGFTLFATGTSANQITFQKSGIGPNPLIVAFTGGTNTPSSNSQDGIWRFLGSDYITIDGIDLMDPNISNPATMEFGYGFFKTSLSDGCQYNTIKNCTITLNRNNNASALSSGPAQSGSKGIEFVNAIASLHTNEIFFVVASGANSYNKFYNNTIQNCNIGISLYGYNDPNTPYTGGDHFNDVGGSSIATGNTIINYGGAIGAVNPADAIRTINQWDINISNNLINNNNGLGVNHFVELRGINSMPPLSANVSINNNTVTVNGGGTTSSITAIQNIVYFGPNAGNNASINNNRIVNCSYNSATSGRFYGIFNSSEQSSISINNNAFVNNSTAATSGSFHCLNFEGVSSIANLNNNVINGVTFTSTNTSVTFNGIYSYSGNSIIGTTLSINSNSIQNISYGSIATKDFRFINNTCNGSKTTIDNNKLINISVPISGKIEMILSNANSSNNSISNNSIVGGFSVTSVPAAVNGYWDGNTATSGSLSVINNNLSNISITGGTSFLGISIQNPNLLHTISSNTLSTISTGTNGTIIGILAGQSGIGSKLNNNLITNLSSDYSQGIHCPVTSISTGLSVYNNTVSALKGLGIGVRGMTISGKDVEVFKNRIYDLESIGSGSSVLALQVNAVGTMNIFNNLIGDLRTPSSNGPMAITGIATSGGGPTDFYNIHYNTIYINATSTGTNYGTAAISHPGAFTPDGVLTLRNNIIVNSSIPTGTGMTIGYFNTTAGLTNYSNSSNNNIFYVGAGPWANRKIYYDGAAYASWIAAKAVISPRETNSPIELPPFISILGSNPNFLNLSTTIPTQAESGGIPIVGVTDDCIGTLRNTSNPDIGAWEGNYLLADSTMPAIIGLANSSCNLSSITVTASLVDASGIAISSLAPRCYYKINANPYTSVQGTLTSGNYNNGIWTFVPSYAAVPGDILSYYVTAQDASPLANIGSMPVVGFSATDVNSVISPPTTIYTVTIKGLLVGTYSVGTGGNFTTLTSAAAAYNTWCLAGPVTFLLTDPNYSALETFPITFSNNPDASNTNSLLIKPTTGLNASITGTVSGNSVISFVDARYINVDGVNSSGSSLNVNNTTAVAAILLSSSNDPNTGCKKIQLHNLKINGSGNTSTNYGILSTSNTAIPNGTSGAMDNDSIIIKNNEILSVYDAIWAIGWGSPTSPIGAWIISDNIIGPVSSGSNNIGGFGIRLKGVNSCTLSTNIIRNIRANVSGVSAMYLSNMSGAVVSQNTITSISSFVVATSYTNSICGINIHWKVTNSVFKENVISGIFNTNPSNNIGSRGIIIKTDQANSNCRIMNNMISDIYSSGGTTSSFWPIGMAIEVLTGGFQIENNSISLSGSHNGSGGSAALFVNTSAGGIALKNNILSNEYDYTFSSTDIAYAIYSVATPSNFSIMDYNDYSVGGLANSLVLGYVSSANQMNLSAIQSSFGNNLNSKNIAPIFTSASDLHLIPGSNILLDNLGTSISGISKDIDLQTRSLTTPDIGADEYFSFPCSTVSGITQSNSTFNLCNGQNIVLNSSGGIGYGLNYQWQISSSPGGPYSNVVGGSGAATLTYSTAPLLTGTYYYVLQTSCSVSSLSAVSNEATVTVNPLPTITASSSNAMLCLGQSATLTTGGANTYSWSTTAVANSIIVNPSINTSYTVIGTDINGCKNSAIITQSVSICTELKEISSSQNEFKIYPNPSDGNFIISISKIEENILAEVYNNLGQLIIQKSLNKLNTEINISHEPAGMYFLRLIDNGTSIYISKLITN